MTPISLVRSRTDCAMVLAVTSNIVKNTAETTDTRMAATLPICSLYCFRKARSVAVLVSAEELANSVSTRWATASESAGLATFSTIQPT